MTETDIKEIQINPEDSKNAFFRGSLDHVYSLYRNRARDAGKTVLDLANFWHKFCLCFPGSGRVSGKQWSSVHVHDYFSYELAVNVRFKSTDTALAGKIDALGWFTPEGEAAVLDVFIQAQETLQNDDIMKDSAVGKLYGSVSDLHLDYLDRARKKERQFWDLKISGTNSATAFPVRARAEQTALQVIATNLMDQRCLDQRCL
jgi:hypothetical protein